MINQLQNSHSQIRVLCSDVFALNTSTTSNADVLSGAYIRNTDDFASFATQFETYRIRAIRFDVYDINPAATVVGYFSTWHDEIAFGAAPSFTMANTVDGPDSQTVPPGTGKIQFSWVATGTLENEFQNVLGSNNVPFDFGGLRFFLNAGTGPGGKYNVFVKAVVDFRGRK
jgi:hypothetical protein